MSTTLIWKRPPIKVKEHYSALKYEIARFYDPEWNGSSVPEWTVERELIPFLQGIKAHSTDEEIKKECADIIENIEKYGEIIMLIR